MPTPKSTWEDLALPELYKAWHEINPAEATRVRKQISRAIRHRQRTETKLARHKRYMGYLSVLASPRGTGLSAVAIAAGVTLAFLFRGEATQGAWIFVASACGLASVFTTGNLVSDKRAQPADNSATAPQIDPAPPTTPIS